LLFCAPGAGFHYEAFMCLRQRFLLHSSTHNKNPRSASLCCPFVALGCVSGSQD
jgi:hypothetical protein